MGLREAPAGGFPQNTLGKVGVCMVSVQRGGAFDSCCITHRALVALPYH